MFQLKSRQAWCRSLWLKDVGFGVQVQRFAGAGDLERLVVSSEFRDQGLGLIVPLK